MLFSAVGGADKVTVDLINQTNKLYIQTRQEDAGWDRVTVRRNSLKENIPAVAWLDECSQSSSRSSRLSHLYCHVNHKSPCKLLQHWAVTEFTAQRFLHEGSRVTTDVENGFISPRYQPFHLSFPSFLRWWYFIWNFSRHPCYLEFNPIQPCPTSE